MIETKIFHVRNILQIDIDADADQNPTMQRDTMKLNTKIQV